MRPPHHTPAMLDNFQALYQTLYANGYYHTAIVFQREHRLFQFLVDAKEELTEEQPLGQEAWKETDTLCTSCRSTAETSQKSWSSRPLQEHYKRDNSHNYTNTTGTTFRICKRCSHHQSFMDSHGSKTWTCHPKHSTGGLERSSAVHKTGHCRAKGKIKSKSYPADVTFREAEKRLMDRVHRWSCVTGKNAPIVAIAEPQNRDSCHVSCVANDNKKTLKPYGTKTTFPRDCNSNHISVKSGNKLDTLDISSCSMDPCTGGETEQLAFQKDPLLEDSFITCSYYDTSTISPSLETDNDFQANLFVDSFSNIFDDLFCENKE